ncbi:MAG TPA: hypothetical protein VFL17_15545 [Anaerolineae bacterium]|nr:hypothetical protein [Anaerolineae bacterium]
MTRASNTTQKITVTLPKALIQRLRKQVPARKRDEFVAQALEERLVVAEQAAVLEETAGAWKDTDHPDMRTPEDIDRWLSNLRGTWPERLTQLQARRM